MTTVAIKRLARLGLVLAILVVGSAAANAADTPQIDPSLFKGMKWRLIGPFRGGRVLAVTGVVGQPEVYYFGVVSGGVWKTTDGGHNWVPLTDKEPFASIGSIAVAESDPNVIYVGTGEGCPRGNISHGDGVYKSMDGGKTWKNVGLRDTQTIPKIIVHPKNPDLVLVAALGHVYGRNAERGLFRSTDGGQTWEKVLYKDDQTGAVDLEFDPTNPHVVWAALWQVNRTPYSLTSGGPGSGLYRSTDDGKTWKQVEGNGLPKGILGRIGISVSGADPNRVYALIEAEKGGLYRSDDGGEHWSFVNGDHRFTQRAWYFHHVFTDPKNVDTLYILNTAVYRSTDGGRTFNMLRAPHGDNHGLWIDPNDPQRMILGNDGGATISADWGKTWTTEDNQPTAQFYHVIADNRFPYYVYGAQQDNSTVGIASAGEFGSIDRSDWYPVGGGESGYIAPYPPDPNIVYAGSYDGELTRFDKRTGQEQDVNPWPDNPMGAGAAQLKYRFQWTYPIVISPHDPNVIYAGAQVVFKSTNGGMSWTVISPDLTRNDKSKQQSSGGPITKDNTSIEYYDTVFAIAESPREKGLIWTGSDDGLVHLTHDGGQHWADVTPREMPEWSLVSLIEASPRDPATAYLAIDRHRSDDLHPYIYKTHDYGKTWTKITQGIADSVYVHAVREDPERKGLLYAGTESGVMVSFDDGEYWQSLQLNLPTVPVHDLVVKEGDLVAATHGRSFWILDDVTPLRQAQSEMARESAYLFKSRVAYRTRLGQRQLHGQPMGENPPAGGIIDYYLARAPQEKEEVRIEIYDPHGKVVRKFSSLKLPPHEPEADVPEDQPKPPEAVPTQAGMNRFVWDLRYDPAPKIPGYSLWEYEEGTKGPLVLPGRYQVKLTALGKSFSVPLEVKLDPRVRTSQADLETQFDLAWRVHQRLVGLNQAVIQLRDLRAQLKTLHKDLAHESKAKKIVSVADRLDQRMSPVEEKLISVKTSASEDSLNYPAELDARLAVLEANIESADTAPTRACYEFFKTLDQQTEEALNGWSEIRDKELATLNHMISEQNIPAIVLASSMEETTQSGSMHPQKR